MPRFPSLSPEHESSNTQGYEDGFEGREQRSTFYCYTCYVVGYAAGERDREEIQRAKSSNA